ncbi:hypothetical protein K4F52_006911 [Lecanicillium sp. MT-2017a]|nr:hypothetical protein K4F52_006911 [Lecanicillium sp. MT-2017a]
MPDPGDSMKSTWPSADRATWKHHHWLLHLLNITHKPEDNPPVFQKTDKVHHFTRWRVHAWIIFHAAQPVIIHQAFGLFLARPLNGWAVFFLYFFFFGITAVQEVQLIRRLGLKYGYLDGDVTPRDGVPDTGVHKVAEAFYKTVGWRVAMLVLLTYQRDSATAAASLHTFLLIKWWCWAFINIGCYGLVVDFWFYWYHRAMHEVDFLWKFHRKHHLTKHPNPLLGAYADEEQEFFDMAVVPFLAFWTLRLVGLKLGFYDWWLAFQYVAFAELMGHGGVRVTAPVPSPFESLYEALGLELVVEDHDLHHRRGYRKSANYGKQTRVWDVLFGTAGSRIEATQGNIDYNNRVNISIF